MLAWAVVKPAPVAAACKSPEDASAVAMAVAALAAVLWPAPAATAATMAAAAGMLPLVLADAETMLAVLLAIEFRAIKVAMASVPLKPMRSRDTSLPHSFQVEVAWLMVVFHQSRWVAPSMETRLRSPPRAAI